MSNKFNAEELVDEVLSVLDAEDADEEEMDEEEMDMITLTMENGDEVPCLVLGIVEIEGQDYIALLPVEQALLENNEGQGFIFRYAEDEEGFPILSPIEDDEEFDMVSSVLDEMMEITVEEEEEE